MRAAYFSQFGGPSVLTYGEVGDPIPGPGEVLIQVRACAINHLDLDIRAGRSRYPISFPHVLGREFAGEVCAVGPDLSLGALPQRVLVRSYFTCGQCRYCRSGQDNHCPNARLPGLHCWGGYAERLVAPITELLPLPEQLSYVDAAAAQIAFGTAWRSLVVLGEMQAGLRVLVLGASGGAGRAAVQVASFSGAQVLAVTRQDKNRELLYGLGAETIVVAQTAQDMVAHVKKAVPENGVDLVFDPVGGEYTVAALDLLAPGGRLIVCGAHTGEVIPVDLVKVFRNQSHIIGSRRAVYADLTRILPLLAAGIFRPVIDATAPLADVAEMHKRIEQAQHTGRIVLVPEL